MVDYLVLLWGLRWWILIPAVGIVGIKEQGFKNGSAWFVLGLIAMAVSAICPLIGEIFCALFITDGKLSKFLKTTLYALVGIMIVVGIYNINFFVFMVVMAIIGCCATHKIYRHFYPKRVIAMPKIKTKKFKL
ncbi:MAG: hypothetical protein J6N45_03745 [Alphaproteobacteria bacterium]|nr:hypothetical protein [Alphaproteobacteria bacterium]